MKEPTFALFVGIVRSYWVGETRNDNQVSFTNIYVDATLHCIALNDSKFIQEYKNKISNWSQYWKNTCTNFSLAGKSIDNFPKKSKNKKYSNDIKNC
jgi:hypothetical protein